MKRVPIYGVDPQKTANFGDIQRDSRTLGQRVAAACRKPDVLGAASIALAVAIWVFPAAADAGLVVAAAIGALGWRVAPVLPLKLPATYAGLDPHERAPGTGRPRAARGLAFLGNDRLTGEELYLSPEDFLTHFLFCGGTGAGKTEAMTGLAANTLLWGSGFTYVDGKGAADLSSKVLALARACGREDDVYVLNYITGSTDVDPDAPEGGRLSNTFNPFLHGSADAITQLLVTQMADAGGDSATWKDKAIGLLTAYVRVMVAMRDRGRDERDRPFVLDVGALRAYLTLDNLVDLHLRAREGVDGFALPRSALEALGTYLESVPGYQDPARLMEAKQQLLTPDLIRARAYPPQPDTQTYLQHGYLQNQFGRMFGQLADVYGHIFRVGQGEIDMADVVLQRRILVVMLPPLEKSPDELASLGKLLIGALKTMLAIGLGARMEGTHREVIDSRPSAAPSPYFAVFDEYGYYSVEGFAVVPAQARSLGFSVCFGGQDIQSFGKQSQEEAAAIVANTLTKVGMFVEDPKDTTELFEKLGGRALAVQSSGLSRSESAFLSGFYRDAPNATYERLSRIDPLDLRAQTTGQAHVLRGTTIVRAQLFYPGEFRMEAYRLNRFVASGPLHEGDIPSPDALAPENVRAAVALATAVPLEALQLETVRSMLLAKETDAAAPAGTARQSFAQRLIERYLSGHAALDMEFAARLREAGRLSDAMAAGPATVSPPSNAGAARQLPAGPFPTPSTGNPARHDVSEPVQGGSLAAERERFNGRAETTPPPAPDAIRAAVKTVLKTHRGDRVGDCYQGGMVVGLEPNEQKSDKVTGRDPRPQIRDRRLDVSRSAESTVSGCPAIVVVDRLEDLDAPDAPAFRADASAVHAGVEGNT